MSSKHRVSPILYLTWIFLSSVWQVPANGGKGDLPQLQSYVALTASLLRSVSADSLSTRPCLIF